MLRVKHRLFGERFPPPVPYPIWQPRIRDRLHFIRSHFTGLKDTDMFTLFSLISRRAFALGLMLTASAYAQSAPGLTVTEPTAASPTLRYESAFSGYKAQQDAQLLPWKSLFTADGAFADTTLQVTQTEVTVRKPEGHSEHEAHGSGRKVTLDPPLQLSQANTATPAAKTAAGSDTQGRIEAINPAEGKVKLKHGPIPKFDMPGMTMLFRVQDPKLLTQIKVGDEVGVTMEQSGGAIVITGFQKIAPVAAPVSAPATAPATSSDTRGRIEAINTAEGKVKFKHGPIPKFDMPGMTMVFRVQDPKLLKQIKVGDEVGATMEQSGDAMVITGFQK
jgi:Cu(I)/Ag(I) efflux system protein CusF